MVADNLAADVFKAARVDAYEKVRDVTAKELAGLTTAHPFRGTDGANGEWDYDVPLLPGDHVTDEAGTGFVHTAPSHGADDYMVGVKHNLPMTHNVGPAGEFRDDLPFFSYPHSWRSKAPLIFRNTPQWFVAMDKPIEDDTEYSGKSLRTRALETIDRDVRWVPQSGRNRLYSMIENRPDWVLSRQRAWGVPLGADAWFEDNAAERFLGARASEGWQKVTDILDVWFDSGCTHAYVLRDGGGNWPASVYLEGTDQHRGWFDRPSRRGEAIRRRHSAPLGHANRLHRRSAHRQRIGPEILKSNADGYRRLRNTFRFMLGALDGFDDSERLPLDQMPELERSILHRLSELDEAVQSGVRVFNRGPQRVLFRHPQRRTLLRCAGQLTPPRLSYRPRHFVRAPDNLARADAMLHDGRSLAEPLPVGGRLDSPQNHPRHPC